MSTGETVSPGSANGKASDLISTLLGRAPRLAMGVATAQLAYPVAKKLRDKARDRTTYTVKILATDDIYHSMHEWVLGLLPAEKQRALIAWTSDRTGPDAPFPAPGSGTRPAAARVKLSYDGSRAQAILVGGYPIDVLVSDGEVGESQGYWKKTPEIVFTMRSLAAQRQLITEINTIAAQRVATDRKPVFHMLTRWGDWTTCNQLPQRDLDSVILKSGQLERIVADVDTFLSSEADYIRRCIPWHRGHLYEGPPGCIQGDAEICINRGGKGFRIKLSDMVMRLNGETPPGQWGRPWNPDTPTYVQREVDGIVRLALVSNAWTSGVKTTYTVTTNTGRELRATDEHPFLTERGWLRLDELKVDDEVHVRGERSALGRRSKPRYREICLLGHPFARDRNRVPFHRLVAEAVMNNLPVENFIQAIRDGHADEFKFLDPETWAVHHGDLNSLNNEPGNLQVLTHSDHHRLHAELGGVNNVQILITTEKVVSVEKFGEEETYDIEVDGDPHNFLANGFVVHNTGKTSVGRALASHFGMDVWYLPLSDVQKDSNLLNVISQIRSRSILLLEDVDVFRAAKERTDTGDTVTLSGLLNALDGFATPHGLFTILTSNEKQMIDPAVLRAGRVDLTEHFAAADEDQIQRLLARWYGDTIRTSTGLRNIPAADVVEACKRNPDNLSRAVLELRKTTR